MKNNQAIFTLILVLTASTLFAQITDVPKLKGLWRNVGVGPSLYFPEGSAACINLGLNYEPFSTYLTSAGIGIAVENHALDFSDHDEVNINYFHLGIGKIAKGKYMMASFTAGPALVNINYRHFANTGFLETTVSDINVNTAGLYLEGKLLFVPKNSLGFGIHHFIILNDEPISGITFSFAFGKLKNKLDPY